MTKASVEFNPGFGGDRHHRLDVRLGHGQRFFAEDVFAMGSGLADVF